MNKLHLMLVVLLMVNMVLLHVSCNKPEPDPPPFDSYISQEDFISILKMGWFVSGYEEIWGVYSIRYYGDSLIWSRYSQDETFSLNDTMICTLPRIENMQNWTFTENGNDLNLETKDLCGVVKNYKFKYQNFRRDVNTGNVLAYVNLIGSDTLTLNNFQIYSVYFSVGMNFHVIKNNVDASFVLSPVDR